jgi:hypothetical protein
VVLVVVVVVPARQRYAVRVFAQETIYILHMGQVLDQTQRLVNYVPAFK